MSKISLRYDAPVTVVVDTETRKVESVTVDRLSVAWDDSADMYDVDTETVVDWTMPAGEELERLASAIAETTPWPEWVLG